MKKTAHGKHARAARGAAIAVVALLAAGLGACREEEQGRPLTYEKGVYQGPPDKQLTQDQIRELQHRGEQQHF